MKRILCLFLILLTIQFTYPQKVKATFSKRDYKKIDKLITSYVKNDNSPQAVSIDVNNYTFNILRKSIKIQGLDCYYSSFMSTNLCKPASQFTYYKNKYNSELNFSSNVNSNEAYHKFMDYFLKDFYREKLFQNLDISKYLILREDAFTLKNVKIDYIKRIDYQKQLINHAINSHDYNKVLQALTRFDLNAQETKIIEEYAFKLAEKGNMVSKINYIKHFNPDSDKLAIISKSAKRLAETKNDSIILLSYYENFKSSENKTINNLKDKIYDLDYNYKKFAETDNYDILLKLDNNMHIIAKVISKDTKIPKRKRIKVAQGITPLFFTHDLFYELEGSNYTFYEADSNYKRPILYYKSNKINFIKLESNSKVAISKVPLWHVDNNYIYETLNPRNNNFSMILNLQRFYYNPDSGKKEMHRESLKIPLVKLTKYSNKELEAYAEIQASYLYEKNNIQKAKSDEILLKKGHTLIVKEVIRNVRWNVDVYHDLYFYDDVKATIIKGNLSKKWNIQYDGQDYYFALKRRYYDNKDDAIFGAYHFFKTGEFHKKDKGYFENK